MFGFLANSCLEALGTRYFTQVAFIRCADGAALLRISQSSMFFLVLFEEEAALGAGQKRRECFASFCFSVSGSRLTIPSRPFGYDQV